MPFILGTFLFFLYDNFLFHITALFYSKKCKYDCDSCKNWHCYYHSCKKKRDKLNGTDSK